MKETVSILPALGGLGLFLLGMVVMTEGLRGVAGAAIKSALMRFTQSPVSGAITGAASTAILQSSSATTVASVGFVGAGLLSFPEALGIIFGANIGTTITGWIVALIGIKLDIGNILLPLVLVGAIVRLFGKGRVASLGFAVAGFALIFVGISTMQEGMAGLQQAVFPESWPSDTLIGLLGLVAIGIAATVVTQSSSAGVAATITALSVGAIDFRQGAALVIGMDVGTTVTAAMATIGGSLGARRTGLAHVIFNIMTGIGALILLNPYIWIAESLAPGQLLANPEISVVAFHTTFNILGVAIVLPFTRSFASFVEALIKDTGPGYVGRLESALLDRPELALNAARETILRQLLDLLAHSLAILGDPRSTRRADLTQLDLALDETQDYCDRIQVGSHGGHGWQRVVALFHAMDHMNRLLERCEEEEYRANTARVADDLTDVRDRLIASIRETMELAENGNWHKAARNTAETALYIHDRVEPLRAKVIDKIAHDTVRMDEGRDLLDAIRWMKRVSKHIAKITKHLEEEALAAGSEAPAISQDSRASRSLD